MNKTIIQIYEIQTPEEARSMVALGVDHVGSVLPDAENREDPVVKETISLVRQLGAVSSLIPLFTDLDAVIECLAYHKPDIVHFCDALHFDDEAFLTHAVSLQRSVKERFPKIRTMRSVPIPSIALEGGDDILKMAARFESVSDFFLTDTVLVDDEKKKDVDQPVEGFVGITGIACDWQVASRLVEKSTIPVILAGGISPGNVKDGILTVRPYGVDSCTRTNAVDESGRPMRFKKDKDRVQALVEQSRQADESIYQNK